MLLSVFKVDQGCIPFVCERRRIWRGLRGALLVLIGYSNSFSRETASLGGNILKTPAPLNVEPDLPFFLY